MSEEKIIKKIISTKRSPKSMGPYSQAIVVNNMVYASGVIGVDKKHKLVEGGVQAQALQALVNLETVLEDVDSAIDKCVKFNVYVKNLSDMDGDLGGDNGIRPCLGTFFSWRFPAKTVIQVERLPMDALVQFDCIAIIEESSYEEDNTEEGNSGEFRERSMEESDIEEDHTKADSIEEDY